MTGPDEVTSPTPKSPAVQPGISCAEFPRDMLVLLRCSHDGGELAPTAELRSGAFGVIDAQLRCVICKTEYLIQDGIARMVVSALGAEGDHEMAIRDREYANMPESFVAPQFGWRSSLFDLLQVPQHLRRLEPLDGCTAVDIGSGDGRFTMLMAQLGARVLAVDFSINALRRLSSRLPSGVAPTTFPLPRVVRSGDLRGQVGLAQADAGQFHLAPGSFDRAVSATPLDSRDQRMAMYRVIADALRDDGRYLCSVEHDDLLRRLLGLPLARRYSRAGIFLEHFDADTLRREVSPYFLKLETRPIRPDVPFISHLPFAWQVRVSLAFQTLPVLREFGEIMLLLAERPVRPPTEGLHRPGNKLAKTLFSIYSRVRHREPIVGGEHERVL